MKPLTDDELAALEALEAAAPPVPWRCGFDDGSGREVTTDEGAWVTDQHGRTVIRGGRAEDIAYGVTDGAAADLIPAVRNVLGPLLALARIGSAFRWKVVADGELPAEACSVFVTVRSGRVGCAYYWPEEREFRNRNGQPLSVVAWVKEPEPYREDR